MNIDLIKDKLSKDLNKLVVVTVYGMRNRVNRYEGVLYKLYPNLFSIMTENGEKSFSYNEYITGEVKITKI
jgi:uncharacterized protein Veg